MSSFRNESEIEELCNRAMRVPELAPYAKYLKEWLEIVNSNSDGWCYWKAGSTAGGKLADLLEASLKGTTVGLATWRRVIGNIKRTARGQLRHGNKVPVPKGP